jgi:TetR/AcrR family transcriptional regulator
LTLMTLSYMLTISHVRARVLSAGDLNSVLQEEGGYYQLMGIAARREREKLQRRNTILEAARHLFFEKGYRTTMDEIAERAELSKGTLYIYFKSKDELYVSIIIEGFRVLEKRMQSGLVGAEGPEEKVKAIFHAFVDHCLENREYFRITQYFLTEDARENTSRDLIDAINMDSMKLLEYGAQAFQEGIEAGIFRDDIDPITASIIAWRSATGILDLAVLDEGADFITGSYSEFFDLAFDFMFRGVKKRAD